MGMAHWTKEECRYFVDVILPQTKYAGGDHDHNAPGKSFGDLAKQMQDAMAAIGIKKRTYRQGNMFQHYYQKVSARAHRRNESDANNTALPAGAQPASNTPSSSAAGSSPQAGPSNAAAGNKRKKDADETETEVDSDDEPLIKKKSTVKATPKPPAKKAKKVVEESESEEEEDLPRPPNHIIYGVYGDLEWDAMEFCRAEEKAAKAARKAAAAALASEEKEKEKKKRARKSAGADKKGKGKAIAAVVESEDEEEEPVARPTRHRLPSKPQPRKQTRSDPFVEDEDADEVEDQQRIFAEFARRARSTRSAPVPRASSVPAAAPYQSPYGNPTAPLDGASSSSGTRSAPYRPIDPKTGAILSPEEYEKCRKGRQ